MSNDWNFPCWQTRDDGPDNSPRGAHGNTWRTTVIPFTTSLTCIFSVLIRNGWTADDGQYQGIFSIGQSNVGDGMEIRLQNTANPFIQVSSFDVGSTTVRHNIQLGDEDGVSNIQDNKWYQVAISLTDSGMQFALNGSLTPKVTVITDAAGSVGLGNRAQLTGPPASNPNNYLFVQGFSPSFVMGAAAYSSQALSLSDQAVLDRIFDSGGQFKNAGEDGSLWFGDVFGVNQPEYYFPVGVPIVQNGTDTASWVTLESGSGGFASVPGGTKKQYT